MIGHPGEQRLLGFLDGDLADGERQRIARHLAGCQRCRDVIQGHRAVRAVLRLEPLPASGGVLGRILDTREGGGAVVLPAVDPEPGHSGRPGYLTLLVSAAAVLVVALVQLVPATPFQAAWQWWSRTVAEFGGGEAFGGFELRGPLMPVPVAEPAKLDPKKLRPMTVRYRTHRRAGIPPRPVVDSSWYFSIRRSEDASGWAVEGYPGSRVRDLVLDPATLNPMQWHYRLESQLGSGFHVDAEVRLTQGWIWSNTSMEGAPPASMRNNYRTGIDSAAIPSSVRTPVTFSYWYVTAAQLMSADLHQGWSGSFTTISPTPLLNFAFVYRASYLVDGSEVVHTPAGTFDTWSLSEYREGGEAFERLWLRKSDGLLVKVGCSPAIPSDNCDTQELLSVTYP